MRGKTAEDLRLLELLDPVAEAAGCEIVRLRLMGGAHRQLQIMAEKGDGTMPVEDCAVLARAISDVLDAADPIREDYTLEVSSPGVDRPLTRLQDFETWAGYEARLELDRLTENRKRFKGVLAGIQAGQVAIDLEGEAETALIPFAWISEAKLVITDQLLKRGAEARAARLAAESPPPAGEGDHEVVAGVPAAAKKSGASAPFGPPGHFPQRGKRIKDKTKSLRTNP